ncbi:MAG TPA: hypothetical protein PLQ13_03230 [Candidatus Krumholzibacteria bacterium]|nr:hypothetical protein [Candidatus Krumholzibacteria bacterium]
MYQNWVDASRIRPSGNGDIWAVDHTAHPLLDPGFGTRRSRVLALTRQKYHRILTDDDAYRRELSRLFQPGGEEELPLARLAERAADYLNEADVYLASTIELLPSAARPHVLPLPAVADCDDVRGLLTMAFRADDPRLAYEARRKLFLGQALLRIDQSRHVQNGQLHMEHFEHLLNEGLWRHTSQVHDLEVGFRMDEGGSIAYTARPAEGDQRWHFRSTFVQAREAGRAIALDILYYSCRFKRSVTPVTFEIVDGRRRVIERIRWSEMRQQTSGSILSKMIRNGINNPDTIADMIGAMFIVHDNDALDDLLLMLDAAVGTPFGWRNVTDTLSPEKGVSLNEFSSGQFKVFKGDVDVLFPDPATGQPYRFPVEVQIYTLEAYLRTVCGAHEASHLALKLRQFLYGLVPRIFPREVYGSAWLEGDDGAADGPRGGL